MDFTDLKEKAREAKLDYDESESLLRFLNFQRERRGEPPIYDVSQPRSQPCSKSPNRCFA